MRASGPVLIRNYLSAMALVMLVYAFYEASPWHQVFFAKHYVFPWFRVEGSAVLAGATVLFAFLLLPFYATFPDSTVPKCRLVWRAVSRLHRQLPLPEERTALLATLVKAFFLPLMLVWLFANSAAMLQAANQFIQSGHFFPSGYWMLFNLILLVDVTCFSLAYAIEHPALKNEIRSVEPTLLGWVVALICYPPFNGMTNEMIGWYSSDYPRFSVPAAQWVAAVAMLGMMSIYLWATLALNVKASNLTNRGIVTSGPYAYVRHPAYLCKNLAWWIGALPLLTRELERGGLIALSWGLFSVLAWSLVYFLRAWTEERHLSRDAAYRSYCRVVPAVLPFTRPSRQN